MKPLYILFLLFPFLSFTQSNSVKNNRQGITTIMITDDFTTQQFNNDYRALQTTHRWAVSSAVGTFSETFDFNMLTNDTIVCINTPSELKDVLNKSKQLINSNFDPKKVHKSVKKIDHQIYKKTKDNQLELYLKNKSIASQLVQKIFNYNAKTGAINLQTLQDRALNNSLLTEQNLASLKKRGFSSIEDEYKSLLQENYLHVIVPFFEKQYSVDFDYNPIALIATYGALLKLDLNEEVMSDLSNMITEQAENGDFKVNQTMFESYPFKFKLIRSHDYFGWGIPTINISPKPLDAITDQMEQNQIYEGSHLVPHYRSALIWQAAELFTEEFTKQRMVESVNPVTAQIGTKDGLFVNTLFRVSEFTQDKDGNKKEKKVAYVKAKKIAGLIDGENSGFSSFFKISGKKIKKNMLLRKEHRHAQSYTYIQLPPGFYDPSNFSSESKIGIGLQSKWPGSWVLMYLGFNPELEIYIKDSDYKYRGFNTSVGGGVEFSLMRIGASHFRLDLGFKIPIYAPSGIFDESDEKIIDELGGTRGAGVSIGFALDAGIGFKYNISPFMHVFAKYGASLPLFSMIPATADGISSYLVGQVADDVLEDEELIPGVNVDNIYNKPKPYFSIGIGASLVKKFKTQF